VHDLPDPNQLLVGAMVFLRIGGILFALPLFGEQPTPPRARILAALALTIGFYPLLPPGWAPSLAVGPLTIAGYIFSELLVGLVIGFLARVAFDGILMAASVVSYQMGFGTGNLFLPDLDRTDGFTAFHRMVVMLIFLSLGLYQLFLVAIADSFKLIPGGAAHFSGPLGEILVQVTAGMLVIAVQLAAPVIVALMFAMAAIGLVARTVPSLNAFQLSFPISFSIGLIVYIATLPFFPGWMRGHFLGVHEQIFAALRALVH